MNRVQPTSPSSDVWAPGVFNNFLREIAKSGDSVAGGVFVGTLTGGLRIDGVVSILDDGRSSAVVLDEESWHWVESVWREFYAKQSLVGWYCSRPGLNALPTDRDVAAHQQFFGGNQAMLVCVDPRTRLLIGYLILDDGSPVEVVRGEIDPDLQLSPDLHANKPTALLTPWAVGCGILVGLLAFFAAGATGWPFA